jgi:hypothetical protein
MYQHPAVAAAIAQEQINQQPKSHTPVYTAFSYGSWAECADCGMRLWSEGQADEECIQLDFGPVSDPYEEEE